LFRAALPWADAGLGRDGLAEDALWALLLVSLVACGYLLGATLPATRALFVDRRVEHVRRRAGAYQVLVRTPLGTVLLEEVAFRGVLYGLIWHLYGPVLASVVASQLFGLWHVLPALDLVKLNRVAGGLSLRAQSCSWRRRFSPRCWPAWSCANCADTPAACYPGSPCTGRRTDSATWPASQSAGKDDGRAAREGQGPILGERSVMSAETLGNAGTGTYVFLVLLGLAWSLWPLAVITNVRGYRESHARRTLRAGERLRRIPPYSWLRNDPTFDRTFTTAGQYVVAIAFLLVAAALVLVGIVSLVRNIQL
jgi:hypothetical protein